MKVSGDGRPKLLKKLWELVYTLLAVSAAEEKLDVPVFRDFFHPFSIPFKTSLVNKMKALSRSNLSTVKRLSWVQLPPSRDV